MSPSEEMVLAYWKEHREQLRQSETQRAVLTNYVLVITAGLSGFIVQQKFASSTMPISALIMLLGGYGALSAAKYHERADYHLGQARALTSTLTSMGKLGPESALDDSRQVHYDKFPRLHRVPLHYLWTGLNVSVSVFGMALLVLGIVG